MNKNKTADPKNTLKWSIGRPDFLIAWRVQDLIHIVGPAICLYQDFPIQTAPTDQKKSRL